MKDINSDRESDCNADSVSVPAQGWWCRQCGVFREVDDTDLCSDCRVATTHLAAPKEHGQRRGQAHARSPFPS